MKVTTGFASIAIALAAVNGAEAKGCLKGAAVGGAAGHYAGHHGVLGAMAGCLVGRHQANKRGRNQNGAGQHVPTNRRDGRSVNEESM
jgi:hypothetical protein